MTLNPLEKTTYSLDTRTFPEKARARADGFVVKYFHETNPVLFRCYLTTEQKIMAWMHTADAPTHTDKCCYFEYTGSFSPVLFDRSSSGVVRSAKAYVYVLESGDIGGYGTTPPSEDFDASVDWNAYWSKKE